MKNIIGAIFLLAPLSAAALEPKDFVGFWNVTATGTTDATCDEATPGSIDATVWMISASGDGTVQVSVQGETNFKSLSGFISKDGSSLILGSSANFVSAWLKLSKSPDGKSLTGIKRSSAGFGNKEFSGPCFADYTIEAKKQ